MKLLLKFFGIIVWFYLVINGISFFIRQKGFDLIGYLFYPPQYIDVWVWDLTDAPYGASLFMGILYLLYPAYVCYWLIANKQCSLKALLHRERLKKSPKYINLDIIRADDKAWITDILQRYKKQEHMIAYSKDGAMFAKEKAINLGIKKCFVDFKSYEEVRQDRRW